MDDAEFGPSPVSVARSAAMKVQTFIAAVFYSMPSTRGRNSEISGM